MEDCRNLPGDNNLHELWISPLVNDTEYCSKRYSSKATYCRNVFNSLLKNEIEHSEV